MHAMTSEGVIVHIARSPFPQPSGETKLRDKSRNSKLPADALAVPWQLAVAAIAGGLGPTRLMAPWQTRCLVACWWWI